MNLILISRKWAIHGFRNEVRTGSTNFRKDFWTGKNWPIADRRVPIIDPTNNCETHFGSSSCLVSHQRISSTLWGGVETAFHA